MSRLDDKVRNLPGQPGVYLFKDPLGAVLYVGKAKSLSQRVRSYLKGEVSHPRLRELMEEAVDLDVLVTDSDVEALLVEATLIRQHHPRYNVQLKDDKSFPYVRVSVQEEWPRLSITRQVRSDGARYFGPYTDVKALRRTLRQIRRIFPVRSCQNFDHYRRMDRPCLFYHIRRCVGPCYSRAQVDPAEYRQIVEGLLLYLSGRDEDLERKLQEEMEQAAAEQRYELAAQRRDQLALLSKTKRGQHVVSRGGADADIVGVARHGPRACAVVLPVRRGRVVGKETRFLRGADQARESGLLAEFLGQYYLGLSSVPNRIVVAQRPDEGAVLESALAERAGHGVSFHVPRRGREKALLSAAERNAALGLEDLLARRAGRRARYSPVVVELQKALDLAAPPYRMVCFDVSNLGADSAVASVVASENGVPHKALYRRMRVRATGPDDFAMLAEAVARYFAHVHSGELPRPDLVMVDGGVGQVSAAREALVQAGERELPLVGLAKREERVYREGLAPLSLPRRNAGLRALQRLRDEAHRFGLHYHRMLRTRSRVRSALDEVPGIGPARRAILLKVFGSVEALRQAEAAEVARRARVPASVAERVVAHLRARAAAG